ncbi:MAG: WYL domain-containing protein [Taibaiella sp.]|nr:WYL domain-containing protein [Taibaiella sp.]
MSKKAYITRYLLILKKLTAKPYSSFVEVEAYVVRQMELLRLSDERLVVGFSLRTFERDIKEIGTVFGVDIVYSRREKGYSISHGSAGEMNFRRMMEAFEIFHSLNAASGLAPYLHHENRRPHDTDCIGELLHAIQNRRLAGFVYHKLGEGDSSRRTVEPYALKEFKNRWYLLAKDRKDKRIKTFALDRLAGLVTQHEGFDYPVGFSVEEHFRYCFGIISPNGDAPVDIVLSFSPEQGRYVKSLPLHPTQQVHSDTGEALHVGLKLYITHDFLMELLSYGDNVMVITPASLAQTLREVHLGALAQYQ